MDSFFNGPSHLLTQRADKKKEKNKKKKYEEKRKRNMKKEEKDLRYITRSLDCFCDKRVGIIYVPFKQFESVKTYGPLYVFMFSNRNERIA